MRWIRARGLMGTADMRQIHKHLFSFLVFEKMQKWGYHLNQLWNYSRSHSAFKHVYAISIPDFTVLVIVAAGAKPWHLSGLPVRPVLLVSPLCTSSHAHTQDLCSSTPENLLGFCTWVVCFQKCNPKPRHGLKLTAENAAALCPDVNARAVFSVIFITHSTFPVPAF